MNSTATAIADEGLVRAAQRGQREAFDTLVQRYFVSVHAIACARLSDRDAAEDLAQEVFLRAYLNLGQLRSGATFAAWVHQMSRNLAIDWIRRGQRSGKLATMVPMEDIVEGLPDHSQPDARSEAERNEEAGAVRNALAAMPPEDRELILLHFAEEMSQREIARRLGVNHTTIGRRLEKVTETFRTRLASALSRSLAPMRPRRTATVRALALVAAAATMPEAARAALAAEAARTAVVNSAVAAAPDPTALSGLLKTTTAIVATGAKIMSIGKTITAGVAIVAIAGGLYYYRENHTGNGGASPAANFVDTPLSASGRISTELDQQYEFGKTIAVEIPYGKTLQLHYPENPFGRETGRFTANADGTISVELTMKGGKSIRTSLGKPNPGNPKAPADFHVSYDASQGRFADPNAKGYMEVAMMRKGSSGITLIMETGTSRDYAVRMFETEKALRTGQIRQAQYAVEEARVAKELDFLPKDPDLRKRVLELADNAGK
ncbi:MAG: RNA polymerase sigma factor [Candidatus Sumerlaeaceae bacterium]|nr:RNA polymerase sigma factor [Candidatus Sumerlaeaceae bacterium]